MCRRVTHPRRIHDAHAAATLVARAAFTGALLSDINSHLDTLGRVACRRLAGTSGTRQVVTRSTPPRTRVAGQQAGAAR